MECKQSLENLLYKFKQGSRKDYDSFVSKLAKSDISDEVLVKYLKSLKDCVTFLDISHEALIGLLLKMDWLSKSEVVIQVYQSLMLNVVSVHTIFLRACLKMIVKKFMPTLPVGEDHDTVTEEMMLKHKKEFTHLHALLSTIVKLVPLSSGLIHTLLVEHYPYQGKPAYLHECYVKNVMMITRYKPELRMAILELVVEKMIVLDTVVPRAAILEDEQKAENQESGVFNMEDASPVLEYTNKLDVLMVCLFDYTNDMCQTDGELDWEATKRFYREMLFIFEKVILPTYACSHVQFIMFYLVSLRMQLCDGFLDYLWKVVQNPNTQAVYRQSAVLYMGSLLSRAKFVSIKTVMRTIELMMKWVHNYTQTCQDCVMADVTHHGPFYSVCQAVFYVFSFRQREILETKRGLKWAESLQFQHLIQSRLNPLKVCLPIVVKTFASITRQHQLAFCDHIIQQNSRSFIPVDTSRTQKLFETYFPFDPYLLKKSLKYIEPHYREFDRSVEIEEDSSGEDDEDELFTADVGITEMEVGTAGSLADKSQYDLMCYGTSPGFKHMF